MAFVNGQRADTRWPPTVFEIFVLEFYPAGIAISLRVSIKRSSNTAVLNILWGFL